MKTAELKDKMEENFHHLHGENYNKKKPKATRFIKWKLHIASEKQKRQREELTCILYSQKCWIYKLLLNLIYKLNYKLTIIYVYRLNYKLI